MVFLFQTGLATLNGDHFYIYSVANNDLLAQNP